MVAMAATNILAAAPLEEVVRVIRIESLGYLLLPLSNPRFNSAGGLGHFGDCQKDGEMSRA